MKKYKLQDLVANGSHSRLKVDSDLLVGDISNGYGYGDVLDANATQQVATGIAENKANAVKQELIELIQQIEGGSVEDLAAILEELQAIKNKNAAQDEKDAEIIQQIENLAEQVDNRTYTVGGDNDNLILS